MDMIFTQLCFYYLYFLLFAQLSQNYSDILLDISVYYLPPIFGVKHNMVLASPLRVRKTIDVFPLTASFSFRAVGEPALFYYRGLFFFLL